MIGQTNIETAEIRTDDNTIFIRRYGNGSPLLMVHGFPRTSLMWRDMAPRLASNHTVICVDLRGYSMRRRSFITGLAAQLSADALAAFGSGAAAGPAGAAGCVLI